MNSSQIVDERYDVDPFPIFTSLCVLIETDRIQ